MKRRVRFICVCVIVMSMVFAGSAVAHPDHQQHRSAQELFPGEGVAQPKQHGSVEGHLPARQDNVRLVGKATVADRSAEGAGLAGRIADVNAKGNYAYLGAYFEPTCDAGGVHVMDISDPKNPFEVEDAFIPASEGQYVGEGVQIIEYRNRSFRGDVLIHNNETCPGTDPIEGASGGISLWDVTDPTSPQPLAENVGDFTGPDGTEATANDSHSMFAWTNHRNRKTYVAMIDNDESTDVDILDITDPTNPVLINDTLDLNAEPFNAGQDEPENLNEIFSHDMFVKRIGQRYVMSLDYWDGGYVLLDVTDPTAGNVTLIDETDFAALDEEQLERGREISPEGNAHQSEISPRNNFVIGTDEDFAPFRVTATIDSGPFAGTEFEGAQSSDTPTLTEEDTISGPTTYLGLACDPATVPAGSGTALIERGGCTFQVKLDNAVAAGYETVIVFNSVSSETNPDCLALLNPLAASETTPLFFIDRATGLQILGQDVSGEAACTTAVTADIGATGADVGIQATFDGWGYVRLFDTNLRSRRGTISADQEQIDTYAIPESQDPAFAVGFGDLSVHEVAIDPRPAKNLAYFSYYAGGFRVAKYGKNGLKEVGAFIDEGGNNFWGVQVHKIKGKQYVLASDRDYGLYIFQYDPSR